jgi:hypothetical protein
MKKTRKLFCLFVLFVVVVVWGAGEKEKSVGVLASGVLASSFLSLLFFFIKKQIKVNSPVEQHDARLGLRQGRGDRGGQLRLQGRRGRRQPRRAAEQREAERRRDPRRDDEGAAAAAAPAGGGAPSSSSSLFLARANSALAIGWGRFIIAADRHGHQR